MQDVGDRSAVCIRSLPLCISVTRVNLTVLRLHLLPQFKLDRNIIKVRLESRGFPYLGHAGGYRVGQAVGQRAAIVDEGVVAFAVAVILCIRANGQWV